LEVQHVPARSSTQLPSLRRAANLPGPRGIPVFGNLLQIEMSRFHQQLERWCDEYGPYVKLRLGKRKAVVISDHEAIAAVMRDRPDGFRRTVRLSEIWMEMDLPIGVFGAEGDVWRRQRRMVMSAFDPTHVKQYFPSLSRVAQRLHGRWLHAAQQNRSIDLQADLMRYTVDTISGLAFGAEINTLESDEEIIQKHLDKIFPALMKRLLSPLPLWRWYTSAADRELKHSVAEVNAAIANFIHEARARMQANPDLQQHPTNLLEAMLAAANEPDSGIDDQQVAGNVLAMLLAGEDTTANTIAWMIYLLWRNPQALTRANEEVRKTMDATDAPTMEQLNKLDYIEACIHETMRLKPVAPQIMFQALHDTTIGDVQIPKDTIIICAMRRDGMREENLANAVTFLPERWIEHSIAEKDVIHAKRLSMPFGAGPRICPGRYLALLEIKMAMAMLLTRFDIENVDTPDGNEAKEQMHFTMAPVGLQMRLRERA
jgi:cytochrome P450